VYSNVAKAIAAPVDAKGSDQLILSMSSTCPPKSRRRQELGKKGSFSKVSMSDELVKN